MTAPLFAADELNALVLPRDEDVVRFDGATLLDNAFFGTHHRARVALRGGAECTVHLPQSSLAETGRPIVFEMPSAAFVVLPASGASA